MTPETRALLREAAERFTGDCSVFHEPLHADTCTPSNCELQSLATRLRAAAGEGEGEDAKSGAGRNERALERWWPTVNSRLSFSAMPPICRDFARWLDAEAAERKRAVLLRAAREVPDVG